MLCPFLLTKHGRIEIPHGGLFRFKMDALKTPANYTVRLCATDGDGEQLNTWKTALIPHTCEVLQRRALHPKAQHLLHREINRIIPVRCHVSAAAAAAAAARVRTPLYRIAVLGFRRRHGGDRGGMGCEAALPGAARLYRCLCFGLTSVSAPGREGPLAGRFILGGVGGGCVEAMMGMAAGAGRQTHGQLVLHRLALLHNP